jgi:hypothetical protein
MAAKFGREAALADRGVSSVPRPQKFNRIKALASLLAQFPLKIVSTAPEGSMYH